MAKNKEGLEITCVEVVNLRYLLTIDLVYKNSRDVVN